MFKYILFDFDGTLIDTNELIILTLKETAKKFINRDLSPDDLNSILGRHLEEQMKCISPVFWEDMMLFYKTYYKANKDRMIKEFPGIREMLSQIKAIGCKTAIVSAKGRSGIEHGLDCFKLSEYIDVIVSAYDIQNNKPHPEPALKALELLCGVKEQSLLIGDSPYDILCGQNAGIKTVLVDWTIFPKNEICRLKPDFIIKEPTDLCKIIASQK
ncbi:MAG: HAD-IA family hydrolase [Clostridia bacterium]|nr:HAD-IA family hydrolase [Clostridia bacterium]